MNSSHCRWILGGTLAALFAAHCASAATGSWSGPDLSGTWDASATNWTGVSDTPWSTTGNVALFNTSGNTAEVSGAIFAGILQLESNTNVVNISGGATINRTIGGGWLKLMGTGHASSSDGNHVTLATPGTSATPSYYILGNSSSFWIGGDGSFSPSNPDSYSYDSLTISDGAYFKAAGGNGTTNSFIGATIGSNSNSLTVRGLDASNNPSTLSHGGQRLYVGGYGNNNSLTVDQGGQVLLRVLHVGAGGSDNAITVDGAPGGLFSFLRVTEDMFIGDSDSARVGTGNSVTVSGGAHLQTSSRKGTEFSCSIGSETGSNNNSLTITGAGSQWLDNGAGNVLLGGRRGSAPSYTWVDAQDNSLNILSGAVATINTGVILAGTRSSFNLGNGTDVSFASVGSSNYGIVALNAEDARLNFNNGRLIANVDGLLVSGTGQIILNGPAYVWTDQTASTITCPITGSGSLTKEGAGTLTLEAGTNTYSGDTSVTGGYLELRSANPDNDGAAVYIDPNYGMLYLNYLGTDVVGRLVIDGVDMSPGEYGSETPGIMGISGVGTLTVTGEVAAASEIALEQPAGNNLNDNDVSQDFGEVLVGAGTELTFTIKNLGNADLTGLEITRSGSADFSVTAYPIAPVSPGDSTQFTLRFAPGGAGTQTAAIQIANNDSNENPFHINLTATGTLPPVVTTTYASWATDHGIGGEPVVGDFDKDGVPNVVEMLLGGDPKIGPDASRLPTLALVTNPGAGVADGNYLEFTYRRTDISANSNVSAACEYSFDLLSWTTAVDNQPVKYGAALVREIVSYPIDYPAGLARVQVYVPRGGNTGIFARLKVTAPGTTYAAWIADHGLGGAPATGDADNDGVPNAMEMVLGGLPATTMDAGLLPTTALVTNPGEGVPDGSYLLLTYRRTHISMDAGVIAVCQYGTDLVSWTTAVNDQPVRDGVKLIKVIVDENYPPYGTAIDRVRVYVPHETQSLLFGRLHVTVP